MTELEVIRVVTMSTSRVIKRKIISYWNKSLEGNKIKFVSINLFNASLINKFLRHNNFTLQFNQVLNIGSFCINQIILFLHKI